MRYRRFALENEIEEAEAKKIVNLYHEVAYPGIKVWHATVQTKLREHRTLINCFGRKRVFMDAWGPELFDAAYAFIPQSTVFDITREAMKKIRRSDNNYLRKCQLLAQVHDQILYQYPSEDPGELSELMVGIALGPMNPKMHYNGRDFHIGTTMRIGRNWSDAGMQEVDGSEDSIRKALEKINGGETTKRLANVVS